MVTLERTMCFGWCPAYALTITADGIVKFTPKGGFALRGDGPMASLPLTGKITADRVETLLGEINRINFFSLKRKYGDAGNGKTSSVCPSYGTDAPSAVITVVVKGKRKTVSHYLGCEGAKILDDLERFEKGIDEIADSGRWISMFGWGNGSVVDLILDKVELASLDSDKQIKVKTVAVDPENDVLTYNYSVSAGKIVGVGANVIWDLGGSDPGTYTITAAVDDGGGPGGKTITRTVTIR